MPSGPINDRYTVTNKANKDSLEQILLVAFSLRMCCSLACSVKTKQRLPSESLVSPTILPGILRTNSFLHVMNPTYGPPKQRGIPRDWPSPTAMSASHSLGVLITAKEDGSQYSIITPPSE